MLVASVGGALFREELEAAGVYDERRVNGCRIRAVLLPARPLAKDAFKAII